MTIPLLFNFNNGPASGFTSDGSGLWGHRETKVKSVFSRHRRLFGLALELASLVARVPLYHIGETMKQLSFHEKKKIRNRLLAIYKEAGKVTERDLLRLSALTGVNYSIIADIHKSTHYHPLQGVNEFNKGKIASNK